MTIGVAGLLACWLFGLGTGWHLRSIILRREAKKILSNWEPGMVITTHDGERLYVCRVESDHSGGSEP